MINILSDNDLKNLQNLSDTKCCPGGAIILLPWQRYGPFSFPISIIAKYNVLQNSIVLLHFLLQYDGDQYWGQRK